MTAFGVNVDAHRVLLPRSERSWVGVYLCYILPLFIRSSITCFSLNFDHLPWSGQPSVPVPRNSVKVLNSTFHIAIQKITPNRHQAAVLWPFWGPNKMKTPPSILAGWSLGGVGGGGVFWSDFSVKKPESKTSSLTWGEQRGRQLVTIAARVYTGSLKSKVDRYTMVRAGAAGKWQGVSKQNSKKNSERNYCFLIQWKHGHPIGGPALLGVTRSKLRSADLAISCLNF